MLVRNLTYKYENDEGKTVEETEVHRFNLSKREVLQLEIETDGWLSRSIKEVGTVADNQQVFDFFEKFILKSWGIREDGGKRFNKSPELYHNFRTSLAYDALFDELAFSDNSARYLADFIKGVMPEDFVDAEAIEKAAAEMKAAQEKALAEAGADQPST